jgi:molecular chaperone GrpE (heat shock protein)
MKTRPAIKITGGLAALAAAGLLAACGTASTTPASPARVEAKAPKAAKAAEKAEAQTAAKRERVLQLTARGQRLAQEIVRLSQRGQADPLSACDTVVPTMRKRMTAFSTVVDKLGGYVQYADDPAATRKLVSSLRDYRDQMSASFSNARTGCAQLKALGV